MQRRGACSALTAICRRFGASLPERLLELSLAELDGGPRADDGIQSLINALQVTEIITPALHADIRHLVRTEGRKGRTEGWILIGPAVINFV